MRMTQSIHLKPTLTTLDNLQPNFNFPNVLTFVRILLIPVFFILFSPESPEQSLVAAGVFAIAALTDLLDGYWARRYSQITKLGRFLDPIADKLLVVTGLFLLVEFQRIAAWLAIAIIAREIAVTGLRSIAATEGIVISAEKMGKYKVFFQVMGIIFLTLPSTITLEYLDIHLAGTLTLYLALALGIASGIQHFMRVLPKLFPGFSLNHPT